MPAEDVDIDVESSPPIDAAAIAQTFKSLLKGLCNKGKQIKTEVCSAFSKTNVGDIQAKDMCGKGNTKISKEYLADNILTLVSLVDMIDPIVNGYPPQLDLEKTNESALSMATYILPTSNILEQLKLVLKVSAPI